MLCNNHLLAKERREYEVYRDGYIYLDCFRKEEQFCSPSGESCSLVKKTKAMMDTIDSQK